MAIERMENGGTMITGKDIDNYRLIVLKSALRLECIGMKKRGVNATAMVRDILGSKTRDKKILLGEYTNYLKSIGIIR